MTNFITVFDKNINKKVRINLMFIVKYYQRDDSFWSVHFMDCSVILVDKSAMAMIEDHI